MANIIRRGIRRLRKRRFMKRFRHFELSSGLGSDGAGKGCLLSGTERISIGKDCFFGAGTELAAPVNHFGQELAADLRIGNHVRCVGGCRITCAGSIVLEDDVLLGPEVFITDHNHGMDPKTADGYSRQPLVIRNVRICRGAWLGQRVCVLPGVTVGAHSIVGAGSVVTKDIPPYSIAVGAPARVVKTWDTAQKRWIRAEQRED